MTEQRSNRKMRQGTVVSSGGDKTCVVEVAERKPHARYRKMMTHSSKLHTHDEDNVCSVGDVVTIMETRPLSKMKRWRLVEVVEKAK